MELLGFQRGNLDHQPFMNWRKTPAHLRKEAITAGNATANPFQTSQDDEEHHLIKTAMAL